MDKTPDEVINFVDRLNKDFDIEKVIFFGSRVRGDHLKSSDYDLIVVSRDFEGIFFTDRISKMYKYWKSENALEVLCYTPEEFEKKKR